MGGVRIECEDCGHYATGFTEKESVEKLREQKAYCPYCFTCTHEFLNRVSECKGTEKNG